jgi:hypothetical protein
MPRKQKRYNFIYKTTCEVNNKYYIGMHSTDNLNDGYIGSGKKLWYYIQKYGRESFKFEILEFLPNRKLLSKREREIVNESLLTDASCLNMTLGGEGGFISEEQQRNRSICASRALQFKLKNDPLFKEYWLHRMKNGLKNRVPRKLSEEEIENLVYRNKTRVWTDDMRKSVSEKNSVRFSGSGNSQYGTVWITKDFVNKKINRGDIDLFITDGWSLGRFIPPKSKQ